MPRTVGWFLFLAAFLFVYLTHLLIFWRHFDHGEQVQWKQPRQVMNSSEMTIRPFSLSPDWMLPKDDALLSSSEWDVSPIVVEDFKLIFFTQAKVGCTVWKQLFRRMHHLDDWRAENCCGLLPWNPRKNGLVYLYHYDRETASRMLQDATWTKAIFVRDPVERFVSAWLDKAVHNDYFIHQHCCKRYSLEMNLCNNAKTSISAFLDLLRVCDNAHWRPQSRRFPDPSYWNFIDFVGDMATVQQDAERLLRKIGAWDEFGASGWGDTGDQAIFQGETGRQHATSAKSKVQKYVSVDLDWQLRRDIYLQDYTHPNISRYQTGSERPTLSALQAALK